MEDDQAARIAALATQVALLHNALRKAVDEIVELRESEGVPRETALEDPLLRDATAALATGEGELHDVLDLIRATRPVSRDARGEVMHIAASIPAIAKLMDRFEHLGLIPRAGSAGPSIRE